MRNRCLLSLLLCGMMMYYAVPKLSLTGNHLHSYFSWAWLILLFFAIAGNLQAVLYTPKKLKKQVKPKRQPLKSFGSS